LKEFCAHARPELTVENVSELLTVADLHGADQLKTHAVAFIKGNGSSVV
jgi:speckle-type POZ protein